MNHIRKEFKLKISDLLKIKYHWDIIQFPPGSSKTYITKQLTRLAIKARSSNKNCFERKIASKLRVNKKSKRQKGSANPFRLIKNTLKAFSIF